MTGEDLLDQSRACARQAEDEDRIGRRVAPGAALGEEFGREHRDRGVDLRGNRIRVVAELLLAQRVAGGEVAEARLGLAAVAVSLAEREVEVQPVVAFGLAG